MSARAAIGEFVIIGLLMPKDRRGSRARRPRSGITPIGSGLTAALPLVLNARRMSAWFMTRPFALASL